MEINDLNNVPAAACNRCGGWTAMGGMSQHRDAVEPVMGRTGCICEKSPSESFHSDINLSRCNTRDLLMFRNGLAGMRNSLPNGSATLRRELNKVEMELAFRAAGSAA